MRKFAVVTLAFLVACAHGMLVSSPYIVVSFPKANVFLEGLTSLDSLVVEEGDLRLVEDNDAPAHWFKALGEGSFRANGVSCHYSAEAIVCNGTREDLSLGGLILHSDGSTEAVNPLAVLAK